MTHAHLVEKTEVGQCLDISSFSSSKSLFWLNVHFESTIFPVLFSNLHLNVDWNPLLQWKEYKLKLRRESWVFSKYSGFLLLEKLTGWVRCDMSVGRSLMRYRLTTAAKSAICKFTVYLGLLSIPVPQCNQQLKSPELISVLWNVYVNVTGLRWYLHHQRANENSAYNDQMRICRFS